MNNLYLTIAITVFTSIILLYGIKRIESSRNQFIRKLISDNNVLLDDQTAWVRGKFADADLSRFRKIKMILGAKGYSVETSTELSSKIYQEIFQILETHPDLKKRINSDHLEYIDFIIFKTEYENIVIEEKKQMLKDLIET